MHHRCFLTEATAASWLPAPKVLGTPFWGSLSSILFLFPFPKDNYIHAMKAMSVLLKPWLYSHTTLTFLFWILSHGSWVFCSYLSSKTPVSVHPIGEIQAFPVISFAQKCFEPLRKKSISSCINKNAMLDHPGKSWHYPPKEMRPCPYQVLP